MAWQAMEVQYQRVRFVVAASRREKPFCALCAEFGISRPTGAVWIKRYAESGLEGIAGAPVIAVSGPLGVGKTSVLNLLQNHIEDKAIVVRFVTWLPARPKMCCPPTCLPT